MRWDATPPDAVLVDLGIPDRFAARLARYARQKRLPTRVIALAAANAWEPLLECVGIGLHGCVFEEISLEDLAAGVGKVARGEQFCSAEVLDMLFRQLSASSEAPLWRTRVDSAGLTLREQEILRLIAQESLSNAQLAGRLSISLHTVKGHVGRIFQKLQARNRREAVRLAADLPPPWMSPLELRGRNGGGKGS